MSSKDNNDNGAHKSDPNIMSNAPQNNSTANHSPYFSQTSSGEGGGVQQQQKQQGVNSPVNWEATAALLGGSGRSPGVAGIDSTSPSQMDGDDNHDNNMDTSPLSSSQQQQQYNEQQLIIPGIHSTKPLPTMQSRHNSQQQQKQLQQVHHHPDLPFLVTHWIAHYNSLQSNSEISSEESKSKTDSLFGNNNVNNFKTQEQKAMEDEARRRIQRAASDLAWSFQTLGAFGTSNVDTSSNVGRPATYSDMARKFAPLLATTTASTASTTAAAASATNTSSSTFGQNDNKSVALLDSLVTSSSLTTAESTKNVLENCMPRSLLEAAYEGSVPGEGSCLIDDMNNRQQGLSAAAAAATSTAATGNNSAGRRVGESTSSAMDVNASLEWLVPTNESSGSAMQNPVLLGTNRVGGGLTAVNSRNTAIQAGEASRHYVTLRIKAIDQQKEIESTRRALSAAISRAENGGSTLSSVMARRSDGQQQFDSESDLDVHRVVAQLQRRVAELNLNFSKTRGEVLDAKRKAERACADMVSVQNRYQDPYKMMHGNFSSSIGSIFGRSNARSCLRGSNNFLIPRTLSQQYHGRQHQSSQLQSQLSLLKSRLSHAITMSCHLIYPVYCLRFDKTGRYFITGADDQIVKVFHLGAGPKNAPDEDDVMSFSYGANVRGAVLVCTLRGHAGVVADIDVSADNSLLATASGDGDVRIWGLRDGCPVAILRGHRDGANMVSWSTLSPFRLVTCGENGLARMWDVRNAALKRYGDMVGDRTDYLLPTRKSSKGYPDQQIVESNTETNDDDLRQSSQNVPPLPQRENMVDDGDSNENNVFVPPLPPGAEGIGPLGNANVMAANENRVNVGDFVAGDAIDEGVEIIAQLQHGNLVNESQLQGPGTRARRKAVKVMCLARCPIGGHFATGSDDGLGRVWADDDDARVESLDKALREVANNKKRSKIDPLFIRSLTGRQRAVLGSATAPSKERLLATLSGHNNPITDMMYSNAGDRILTASQKDGVVRIWSWSKENTIVIDGHSSNTSVSDFQTDGRHTKFSNLSQVMIRLTPVTQRESSTANATRRKGVPSSSVSQSVNCDGVAWTCDDMKVVTSQSSPLKSVGTEISPGSQMIYVWDSHSGKCLMGIHSSHTSLCSVLVPHPTIPSVIASAGLDGALNIWDLEQGHLFCKHSNKLMHGPIAETSSRGKQCGYLQGQFSPDGLTLLLTDENGRVSIFDTLAAAADIRNETVLALPTWMKEQYFANDYYDLFYDSNGYCIERGSEQPPHLAPKGVRCTHEGVSYSEDVRNTYLEIEGPSPLPEDVVRWNRDDVRARSASVRKDGGMLTQSVRKKATIMVESPGILSGCKTTAIIGTDGRIVNLDRKARGNDVNEASSRTTSNRSSRSPRLSSRYRWVGIDDLSDDNEDIEDEDDEDFQLGSGRRTSRQNYQDAPSSEDDDEVEILDESPERRRSNGGQRRSRGRQNRRRDRSVLFEESAEPVRASSRTISRRTYEELDSDDEQLNELMSTHTRPSGEYYEDWTVAQHFFKMPRGEGGQVRRNWVSRTSNAGNTLFKKMYCPQVGDSVVYIPRAHYDTMQKFPIASYVGPWKSWPTYSLWPVVCCKVTHIRYRFPYEMYQRSRRKDEKLDGVAAILTLDIIGVPAAQSADRNYPWPSPNFVAPIATRTRSHESTSTFEVTMFESDQTEFIIPEFLYSWRIRALEDAIDANDGNVDGIGVTLRCAPDPGENERAAEDPNYVFYHGRLKDVLWRDEREFHFECSGHNSLSMNWELEDGAQEEEVIHVCSWDIAINNAEPPEVPTMSKEMKKELLSALNEVLRIDEKVREWFYLQVDTSQYTDYFDMIEVPMYISLIQSRLRNNYYTNKYSVLSDVELIKENCYKYNEDNNEFYDLACEVYDKFKALVDAIETPDNEMTTTFSSQVQESTRTRSDPSISRHANAPASSRRTNGTEPSRRSTRTRQMEQNNSEEEEEHASSRHKATRRSTRGQPKEASCSESEEEVDEIDEDEYEEEAPKSRSTRRSTRGKPKDPSSSESEEEVDEIDEDDYEEEAPKSRSTRRSTRGKPKDPSSSESEEEEDEMGHEEDVSPRRSSTRRSTRGKPKEPNSSESEEEDYEEVTSPRSRPTRRATRTKPASNNKRADGNSPNRRAGQSRRQNQAKVEKEPESPSRQYSRTRASKPSYVEKNSDDEEWAEDYASDGSEDDFSSDEDARDKKQKKRGRSGGDGAPPAKKSKKSGYLYYPDLAKWPPVSRRKINKVATAVIQKVRELDAWNLFTAPVCEVFPEVADAYNDAVSNPMDLRTIEEERLPTYGLINELQEDLILTFKNCCVFNGEGSEYYGYAVEIWHSLNDVFKEACEEEGVVLPPRFT